MDFCTGITQRIKVEQELKEVVIFALPGIDRIINDK